MVQFDTIPISTVKRRERRKLTPIEEAERVRKMRETKRRKSAERTEQQPSASDLAKQVADLTAQLQQEHERCDALQHNLETASGEIAAQASQINSLLDVCDLKVRQIDGLQTRLSEVIDRKIAAEHQRDALQPHVLIHGARTGSLTGTISLLLAALETTGDHTGRCTWCGAHRLDGDDQDTEPHQESCVVARAMAAIHMKVYVSAVEPEPHD